MEKEKLFLAIMDKLQEYAKLQKIIGSSHPTVKRLCNEIAGMEEAFKIVFDISYSDYLINRN